MLFVHANRFFVSFLLVSIKKGWCGKQRSIWQCHARLMTPCVIWVGRWHGPRFFFFLSLSSFPSPFPLPYNHHVNYQKYEYFYVESHSAISFSGSITNNFKKPNPTTNVHFLKKEKGLQFGANEEKGKQ